MDAFSIISLTVLRMEFDTVRFTIVEKTSATHSDSRPHLIMSAPAYDAGDLPLRDSQHTMREQFIRGNAA